MKRLRILHTADLHLDAAFTAIGGGSEVGGKLRAAQRRAFARIMERARDWPADMVLIAGDLFDSLFVTDDTVAFVLESFEQLAPIPVYVAPGNRDPYVVQSPYPREMWPGNVTIFTPGAWTQCDHPLLPVTIHGIGCDGTDDTGAWFESLEVGRDGRVHVAVAHGSERACKPEKSKVFAPFDAAAVAQEGLAYLALGHYHEPVAVEGDFPTVMRYPGMPQGRDFSESGPRCLLEVQIEYDGAGNTMVQTASPQCAEILFETQMCEITSETAQELAERLAAAHDSEPARRALQVQITGGASGAFVNDLHARLSDVFFHVVLDDQTEAPPCPPIVHGQRTCLARLASVATARIADEPDRTKAALNARARELALDAARGTGLPVYDAGEAQP